nr:MAG TPA: hypothetical protein [Caudoviricetes sp.]
MLFHFCFPPCFGCCSFVVYIYHSKGPESQRLCRR